MSKTITDLRDSLFETMDLLKKGKIDVNQAKAVSSLAQTIVNSAKVENDYLKGTGQTGGSGFIQADPAPKPELPKGVTKVAHWKGV